MKFYLAVYRENWNGTNSAVAFYTSTVSIITNCTKINNSNTKDQMQIKITKTLISKSIVNNNNKNNTLLQWRQILWQLKIIFFTQQKKAVMKLTDKVMIFMILLLFATRIAWEWIQLAEDSNNLISETLFLPKTLVVSIFHIFRKCVNLRNNFMSSRKDNIGVGASAYLRNQHQTSFLAFQRNRNIFIKTCGDQRN